MLVNISLFPHIFHSLYLYRQIYKSISHRNCSLKTTLFAIGRILSFIFLSLIPLTLFTVIISYLYEQTIRFFLQMYLRRKRPHLTPFPALLPQGHFEVVCWRRTPDENNETNLSLSRNTDGYWHCTKDSILQNYSETFLLAWNAFLKFAPLCGASKKTWDELAYCISYLWYTFG